MQQSNESKGNSKLLQEIHRLQAFLMQKKIQFLLKISIIMNLRVIQCPCKKEQTSYTPWTIRKCSTLWSSVPLQIWR